MFCKNCGKELDNTATVCKDCGCLVNSTNKTLKPIYNDKISLGWAFLGFFFPVAGLVLYLVWKKDRPNVSATVGLGALIGAIVEVVVYILIYFLFIILFIISITSGL